jgi:hypothetical protein
MGHGTGSHLCFRTALRLLELVIECCHVNEKIRRKVPRPALRPSDRQTLSLWPTTTHGSGSGSAQSAAPCTEYAAAARSALRQRIPVRQISKHALLTCLAVLPPSPPLLLASPTALVQLQAARHVWASETTPCLPASPSRTVFDYSSCRTVILPPDLFFYLLQPASHSPSSTTLALALTIRSS